MDRELGNRNDNNSAQNPANYKIQLDQNELRELKDKNLRPSVVQGNMQNQFNQGKILFSRKYPYAFFGG